MTYVPHAFVQKQAERWWVVMTAPSGLLCRLAVSYQTEAKARAAITVLGFKLIDPKGCTSSLHCIKTPRCEDGCELAGQS